MVLHSDVSFMPKRKSAWSSWVYLSNEKQDKSNHMCVSYWMNNLQPLGTDIPIIVTLNPPKMPKSVLTYDQAILEHPVFDKNAILAQERLEEIQGKDRIWYCGAWQKYGFHEDGLASAIKMVSAIEGKNICL
jgi:predicted NAD/FAD-binding protein